MGRSLRFSLVAGVLLVAGYGLLLLTGPEGRDPVSHAAPLLIAGGLVAVLCAAWWPGEKKGK
jgi:hypothetical protein